MTKTLYDRSGQVFTETETWCTLCCSVCHVLYAVTERHRDRCCEDGSSFYCPNGHVQVFIESDNQRLTKERNEARRERDANERWYQSERDDHSRTKKQRNAFKGKVTEVKRRISKGVCPCCTRTFQNLARHMESKHPEYVAPENPENTG